MHPHKGRRVREREREREREKGGGEWRGKERGGGGEKERTRKGKKNIATEKRSIKATERRKNRHRQLFRRLLNFLDVQIFSQ